MRCRINLRWDAESAVWIATSDDVRGLILESGSFDALVERVKPSCAGVDRVKRQRAV